MNRYVKEEVWKKLEIIADLEEQEFVDYDVKEEAEQKYSNEHGYRAKIEEYKQAKDGFDADVSLFSMVSYALAFPYILELKNEVGKQEEKKKIIRHNKEQKYEIMFSDNAEQVAFHGDTMNSFQTIVAKADEWGGLEKEIEDYAKWVHTIGNFIPTPHYYNGKNSGNVNSARYSSTKDFWDITLYWIYEWYQHQKKGDKKDKDFLKALLGKNKNVIVPGEYWLQRFDSWDSFVEQNYMQDFVTGSENEKGKFGKPIEFWPGHFAGVLPKTKEQCQEFLEKVPKLIERRGKRIVSQLKINLANETKNKSYEELAEKFTK